MRFRVEGQRALVTVGVGKNGQHGKSAEGMKLMPALEGASDGRKECESQIEGRGCSLQTCQRGLKMERTRKRRKEEKGRPRTGTAAQPAGADGCDFAQESRGSACPARLINTTMLFWDKFFIPPPMKLVYGSHPLI